MNFFLQLAQIIALLVALTFFYGRLVRILPTRGGIVAGTVYGLLFAMIAVIGMLIPVELSKGVIMDGRTLIVSLAAQFGGAWASVLAAILTSAYRYHLGGIGAYPGIGAILAAAAVGILFVRYWPDHLVRSQTVRFIALGVVNAICGLLSALTLPDPELAWKVVTSVAIWILFFYPAIAVFIGTLLWQETQRLETEESLREKSRLLKESEQKFRAIVENSPTKIHIKDTHGCYTLVNPKAEQVFGVTDAEARGKTTFDIFPKQMADNFTKHDLAVKSSGKAILKEETFFQEDGVHIYNTVKFPIFDGMGEFAGVGAIGTDITERKLAEDKLRESETQLRMITDSLPVLISYVDSDQRYRFNNKAYEDWFLTSRETVLGRRVRDVLGTEAYQALRGYIEQALSGETVSYESLIPYQDGGDRHISANYIPHRGEDGEIKGFFVLVNDITEHKRLEQELVQTQKMKIVGQLTGGVAHDFNNLLHVILGNLQLLRDGLDGDDEQFCLLDNAINAGNRSAELTRQLLAFSRKQILNPKTVDTNDLIEGMIQFMQRTLGEDVVISTALEDGLPTVTIDPGALRNAVFNLALNARAAMPAGGTMRVATESIRLEDGLADANGELAPGAYATLTVSDDGCGMSREVAEQAFEPFFTTKDVGEGSGLGLSMVFGFVKQSNGHLTLDSEPGHGTSVRMYLPVAGEQEIERSAENEVPEAEFRGSETVLVVEDDPEVRKIVAKNLTGLGYRVLEAEDGPSALEVLERRGDVDLLFSDVVMPGGMSGLELIAEARRRHQSLGVLLTTGYPARDLAGKSILESDPSILKKPYEKADLAAAVKAAIKG